MLLPDKHITLSQSILGLGAFVLETVSTPKTIDELWQSLMEVRNTVAFPAYHSFDNLIAAICFLHSINAIDVSADARLRRCD